MSLSRNVLVIGAHGKVALYMTPLLRNLGYSLTSMIRDESQSNDIKTAWESAAATEAKTDRVGKLSILVSNLEDVKSEEDAKRVIEEAGKLGNGKEIDTVVWSAGTFFLFRNIEARSGQHRITPSLLFLKPATVI